MRFIIGLGTYGGAAGSGSLAGVGVPHWKDLLCKLAAAALLGAVCGSLSLAADLDAIVAVVLNCLIGAACDIASTLASYLCDKGFGDCKSSHLPPWPDLLCHALNGCLGNLLGGFFVALPDWLKKEYQQEIEQEIEKVYNLIMSLFNSFAGSVGDAGCDAVLGGN